MAADLPAYGDSLGPAPDPDHGAYSKRATAATLVAAMAALELERFAVAGRCPLLALWAPDGSWSGLDPLAIWRRWADHVDGHPVDCGHFLMEEAPDVTAAALPRFLDD